VKHARPRWAPPPASASLIAAFLTVLFLAPPAAAAPRKVSASFTFAPRAPLSLWPVTFTSTSTATGTGNEIASQTWDLDGDGNFEGPVGAQASRSFAVSGAHQVRLRVVDTKGNTAVAVETVNVGNRRPIASIARFPQEPHTGEAVTFFSTSVDQDGSIESQAWDLDSDGKLDDGKQTLASRSFAAAGVYTVRLRVTDNSGSSHDATLTFAVTDPLLPGATSTQGAATRLMSPFPIVRLAGNVKRRGTRVRLLTVQAPAQARVQVACSGRGCPFRSRAHTVGTSRQGASPVRFRQFRGRLLRPGVSLRVFVTGGDAIGKYTRFRVRRSKPPARTDRCLAPGARAPMRCPG
jgi:hypothetical protein